MNDLFGQICLTDIPKELIVVGKNGKKYLNVLIKKLKTPSKFDYTHSVQAYVKKDQRKPDTPIYYMGNMRECEYAYHKAPQQTPASPSEVDDELGF